MQYFSTFPTPVPVSSSSEPQKGIAAPAVELRSPLAEHSFGSESSQRAAIAKAYSDILMSGGHFGC
jgi:hypothetical protein